MSTPRSQKKRSPSSSATVAPASTVTRFRRAAGASPTQSRVASSGPADRASILTTPGEGTEVELHLARSSVVKRRVVLVDDHDLFLAGVRAELGDAVEVVGQAGASLPPCR